MIIIITSHIKLNNLHFQDKKVMGALLHIAKIKECVTEVTDS